MSNYWQKLLRYTQKIEILELLPLLLYQSCCILGLELLIDDLTVYLEKDRWFDFVRDLLSVLTGRWPYPFHQKLLLLEAVKMLIIIH